MRSREEEMLKDLASLVRYNSERKPPEGDAPFGRENAECLRTALKIAERMGFETVNMENYCGYAQIGEGEDIIGIAVHLDIVPAGKGWYTDPFTLTQKGDRVYGRGVSDDKGAAVASLYALKAVMDSGIKLNKRIRLIFGCAEETGSDCMKYYGEHGERITLGFTPDGNFPGIHGEKGMCAMVLRSRSDKIISMNGGFVTNAVCDRCETRIKKECIDRAMLESSLSSSPLRSYEIEEDGDSITIEAIGVSAHASTPLKGVNAAGYTLKALKDAGIEDDLTDLYLERIGLSCDGEGMGIKCSDEFSALTLSNGIVNTEDGNITFTIDIRFPVTMTGEELKKRTSSFLKDDRGEIEITSITESLFYPIDSPLVSALGQAYVFVTGDYDTRPQVMGGGTYAKFIPGIIAFGCKFPNGIDNHIHDANESLSIDELLIQSEIYIRAIENLLEV